jgi:hypothetical protein
MDEGFCFNLNMMHMVGLYMDEGFCFNLIIMHIVVFFL